MKTLLKKLKSRKQVEDNQDKKKTSCSSPSESRSSSNRQFFKTSDEEHSSTNDSPIPTKTTSAAAIANNDNVGKEKKHIWISNNDNNKSFEADYNIVSLISNTGANSIIYRCMNKLTKKTFAVKIIDKRPLYKMASISNYSRCIKAIQSEVEILTMLKGHPNVVQLNDIYENKLYLYIIMEEIEDGDLFCYINKNNRLTEAQFVHIMHQLLSTLSELHEKYHVIHGDLKPENILLTKDHQVKIIDFGMSVVLKPFRYLDRLIGSPYYTAPEVIKRRYNHASDLWSVGVIMYVSLFGYFPFFIAADDYPLNSKEHNHAIYEKIQYGFQPIIVDIQKYGYGPWFPNNIQISQEARDLISRLLQNDSTQRLTATEALSHPWIKQHILSNN